MSQKKKVKHKKTGVILEYKYGNYYVDGVDVPDWYVKLHLNVNTKYNVVQKDEWDELATFDINYVKHNNGCICGHNGETYNKSEYSIHQITVYLNNGGEEIVFKIGDYVTNGTPMKGKIVKIDLGDDSGMPYITTDWSNVGMVAYSCYHTLPPETKFDLVNLSGTEKLTLYRELKKIFYI